MSSVLWRRLSGSGMVLTGIFLVVAEVGWRTEEVPQRFPRLPVAVGDAIIFLIGFLGLLLIYLGVRFIRMKKYT